MTSFLQDGLRLCAFALKNKDMKRRDAETQRERKR